VISIGTWCGCGGNLVYSLWIWSRPFLAPKPFKISILMDYANCTGTRIH